MGHCLFTLFLWLLTGDITQKGYEKKKIRLLGAFRGPTDQSHGWYPVSQLFEVFV